MGEKLTRQILVRLLASVVAAGGILQSGSVAFATTTSEDTTISNLSQELTSLHAGLVATGGLSTVSAVEAKARTADWNKIVFPTATTLTTSQQNVVKAIQDLVQYLYFSGVGPDDAMTDSKTVKTDLQAIDSSITGTEVYNLFEAFKSSIESQIVGTATTSDTALLDNALSAAFSSDSKIGAILTNNNLTVGGIQTEFTTQVDPGNVAFQDDVLATAYELFDPASLPDLSTMLQGSTRTVHLNVNGTLPSFFSFLSLFKGAPLPVTWTSSNPNVATVTAGPGGQATVTAVGGGTTTLSAQYDGIIIYSEPLSVAVPVVTIAAPTGLSHSNVTPTAWTESWNAVSGASNYNVFVNGTFEKTTSSTSFPITGKAPNTTYTVTVTAVNGSGVQSASSAADSVTTASNSQGNSQGDNGQGNQGQGNNGNGNGGNGSQGNGNGNQGQGNNGNGNGNGNGNSGDVQKVSSVSFTVASVDVGSQATSLSKQVGSTTVQLDVPAGAFTTDETVTVTGDDSVSDLNSSVVKILPKGATAVHAFGVNFSGPAPTVPITLTISDPSIPAGAVVYKVTDTGLVQVPATVVNGQAVISFSTDPYFIITTPPKSTDSGNGSGGITIGKGGHQGGTTQVISPKRPWIELNGTQHFAVSAILKNKMTYVPIWYVEHALKKLGFHSKWNGNTMSLDITEPKGIKPNYAKLSVGHGSMSVYVDGKLVEHIAGMVAKDPRTGRNTVYMPVQALMTALGHAEVKSTWKNNIWNLKLKK